MLTWQDPEEFILGLLLREGACEDFGQLPFLRDTGIFAKYM